MSIENLISERLKTVPSINTGEQITLRLPPNTISELDELALSLDLTRNQLLSTLISDALPKAQAFYDEAIEADSEVLWTENEKTTARRFVFLNTNKRWSLENHRYIVDNGIAACFEIRKTKIDRLKENDTIFIYENGVGIVGIGQASGTTEIKDDGETHEQKLKNYKRVKPFSAREIKKATGKSLPFLAAMFKLSNSNDGLEIEKHLQSI
jgi:hypothetical protein